MMEDYLDNRVIIPDEIMKMTKEELDAEIERLEKEAAREKQRILAERVENSQRNNAPIYKAV